MPSPASTLPVAIVGGGPIGLTAALGLAHHGIPFVLFEDDDRVSLDTKAGTTLSRTLEIWRRYGVVDGILRSALRVDEIGDIDRATGLARQPVVLSQLGRETRYPFAINLPQSDMEPVLMDAVRACKGGAVHMQHKLVRYEQRDDRVLLHLDTPAGPKVVEACYLFACDGGRSTIREQMGVKVEGESLPEKYALIDLKVDLDVGNPRDYPYLAYFSDAREWMILVRHPHCWRFLFPLQPDVEEPSAEHLRDKVLAFIGAVDKVEIVGKVVYRVHHRVASQWRDKRVFLMGDSAHLITPMWALGLNTGALDASNLPWRLAWFLRGWADESVLDAYEAEQRPVALNGSKELAEAARRYVAKQGGKVSAMDGSPWANALTRSLLGVKLDVDGSGDWSMVKLETEPMLRAGDRLPDWVVHTAAGTESRLHDLVDDRFVALYFTDLRRRPAIPQNDSPALAHYAVSRWDAPLDSGLRDRSLLDLGDALFQRSGLPPDTVVLVRPDEHIAAMAPMSPGIAGRLYRQVTGRDAPKNA